MTTSCSASRPRWSCEGGPPHAAEHQRLQSRTAPAQRSRPEPPPPTGSRRRTTDGPQQGQRPPPGCLGAEPQARLGPGPASQPSGGWLPHRSAPGAAGCPPRTDVPEGHVPSAPGYLEHSFGVPCSPHLLPLDLSQLGSKCPTCSYPTLPSASPAQVSPRARRPQGLPPFPTPDTTVPTTLYDRGRGPASLEALEGGHV